MRNEARLFGVIAAYMLVTGVVYAWWTDMEHGRPEWAGTWMVLLGGGLGLICGLYFAFIARRIDPRPEDRPHAEVVEGAGEVGFFSPGSYWPLGVALSAAAAAYGVVVWQWWLVATGVCLILITTGGLLFEYYTGSRR